MMRRTRCAGVLAALTLAACGSVSDSVDFHAPAGYVSKASLGSFMQVWQSSDGKSALMVMQLPGEVNFERAMNSADIKNATVKKREQITICGNQPALFAEVTGTSANVKLSGDEVTAKRERSNIDFLVTHGHGNSYFAMYAWPLKDAPNPAAQSAIRDLCAKK
ncbi:MAG: hypothetical protein ABI282_09920 [Candidatus Baltobacteraceae bacterium]